MPLIGMTLISATLISVTLISVTLIAMTLIGLLIMTFEAAIAGRTVAFRLTATLGRAIT